MALKASLLGSTLLRIRSHVPVNLSVRYIAFALVNLENAV